MKFTNNLIKLLSLAVIFLGESMNINSMEQQSRKEIGSIDQEFFQRQWELQQSTVTHFTKNEIQIIYESTSAKKSSNTIPEDSELLLPYVLQGNPVALYELAQRDGGKARLSYNGTQKKLLMERGILLLIAAIKGKHIDSKKSLNFAADKAIDYHSLTSLETIIEKAEELMPRL